MYFGEDIEEELDVVGTDNFIEYVKGISEEGVELEEIAVGGKNPESGPIVICIDDENPNKDLLEMDIGIPEIPKRYGRDFLALDQLNPHEFKFKPKLLKYFNEIDSKKKIIFRETIDNVEVKNFVKSKLWI